MQLLGILSGLEAFGRTILTLGLCACTRLSSLTSMITNSLPVGAPARWEDVLEPDTLLPMLLSAKLCIKIFAASDFPATVPCISLNVSKNMSAEDTLIDMPSAGWDARCMSAALVYAVY